ncbi:hypothetical protein EVAR_68622_1 [Eumeta japonica]|uniref:Uncharacterized protein n=1 Tax=Eumeta variegata TaxID=151549 RepID=A0A4C2A9E0_EUMVA|nr:hypothetical protein EVAR_68622_1 [Eumeta japonica]
MGRTHRRKKTNARLAGFGIDETTEKTGQACGDFTIRGSLLRNTTTAEICKTIPHYNPERAKNLGTQP